MTIYVDQFPGTGWGRWQGGGHMLSTDIEELHAMALRIGLKREWFQDMLFPHYDLVANKHRLAVAAGAIEIPWGIFPDDLLVRRKNGYECYSTRRARHAANKR